MSLSKKEQDLVEYAQRTGKFGGGYPEGYMGLPVESIRNINKALGNKTGKVSYSLPATRRNNTANTASATNTTTGLGSQRKENLTTTTSGNGLDIPSGSQYRRNQGNSTGSTLTPDQIANIKSYARQSADQFNSGVSPETLQQGYSRELGLFPSNVRAEAERIFANEINTYSPGTLSQFQQYMAGSGAGSQNTDSSGATINVLGGSLGGGSLTLDDSTGGVTIGGSPPGGSLTLDDSTGGVSVNTGATDGATINVSGGGLGSDQTGGGLGGDQATGQYGIEDLNQLYLDILGREVGDAGKQTWTQQYVNETGQGISPDDAFNNIRNSIIQSDEFKDFTRTNLQNVYQNILGREVGEAGLGTFTPEFTRYVQEGQTSQQAIKNIQNSIAFSEEAKNRIETLFPQAKEFAGATQFIQEGLAEFDPEAYLAANPDVKQLVDSGQMTAAEHFIQAGAYEGRDPTGDKIARFRKIYEQNPNISQQDIGAAMRRYGIDPDEAASILGISRDQALEEYLPAILPQGYTPKSMQSVLANVYRNELGRFPGKQGFGHWATRISFLIDKGMDFQNALTTITNEIASSPEAEAFRNTGETVTVAEEDQLEGLDYGEDLATTEVTQITPGQPRGPGELNVADYAGMLAVSPEAGLSDAERLSEQITQLDADAPGVIQGGIEGVTRVTAGEVSSIQKVDASTVSTRDPQEAVTGIVQTTDIVDKPELATMTAEKSYEKVNAEADALQAARLELNDIDPRATVQGQLAILQKQFEGGNIPVWAQGPYKQVNALMASRGVGGSTIAAEAITNALLQSTIPIAQQDASFHQNITMQNLANEQQVVMEQFGARVNALFNDQAAENAARNLNTQSENQLNQFFSELSQNVALANTAQVNSMEQFNATARNQMTQFYEELNVNVDTFNADQLNDVAKFNSEQARLVAQFNAEMKQQAEQFNALNQLAIDQSNVQWRRDVATANTATANAATQLDVQNMFNLKTSSLNNIWQQYDTMLNFNLEMEATKQAQAFQVMLTTMQNELAEKMQNDSDIMDLIGTGVEGAVKLFSSSSGTDWIKKGWDFFTG